jgi:hypothetical protein
MNSSRAIIFSQRLNIECSKKQNEYFLHEYTAREKSILQKQWGFFNKASQGLKQPSKKTEPEKPKQPSKKVVDNKLILKKELSDEDKLINNYRNAREKTGLHDSTSELVAENLVFSDDLNSENMYQSLCTLKLSFETNIENQIGSVRQFDIQFHYQIEKNGMTMGLDTETSKLKELTEKEAKDMKEAIKKIELALSDDNQFQTLKEKIAKEQLSAGKQISDLLEQQKAPYTPISFACSTRILTVADQNTKLPLEIFPCSEYNEDTQVTTINKTKIPNLSQIKTKDYYINKHCVYYKQTDFILGTNTDDVIIRAELTERNNKTYNRSDNINNDELTNTLYRFHNEKVLPAQPTKEASCGLFNWLIELMKYLGKLIDDAILAMSADEPASRNRFDM